jgi:uncharacterized protein (TIGR03435 family)
MKRLLTAIAGIGLLVTVLHGQAGVKFDVVSVKRNTGELGPGGGIGQQPGGRWQMINMPIASLIYSAYPTPSHELVGLPDWVTTERYDVVARAAGVPTRTQLEAMLRAVLADRFAFRGHVEAVERPVYALVVARPDGRLGPDIRRFTGDCAAYGAAVQRGETPAPPPTPANGAAPCGMLFGGDRILAGGISMEMLATNISQAAGRVVIDRTNLPGVYEFSLHYSMRPGPAAAGDETPSIFVALHEQLGLTLEPARAPIDRVVVEHIERPTAD